jgi:hypothetical protein
VGAAAVALWFLAVDLGQGRAFHTPAALAGALFLGAQASSDVPVTLGLISAFTVVHLTVFGAFGVLFVAIARGLERAPQFVLLTILAAIVLDALVMPTMALTAEWVLGTIGWWSVAVGNALAIASMAWRVWSTHPALRHALHSPIEVRT